MINGRVLSAALFISGICIGIAYLNTPVYTGIIGFIPTTLMMILAWAFCLSIGLLYTEATLTQPDGANLPTISRALLGKIWMVILCVIFFINLITFLASYAFLTTEVILWFFKENLSVALPRIVAELLSTISYGIIVFSGVVLAHRLNILFILGLLFSFALMWLQGSTSIDTSRLFDRNWTYTLYSVPLLFSAMSFVGIVPVTSSYLGRDPRKIKAALVIGTIIPLIFYLLWQWLIVGSFSPSIFWVMFEKKADSETVIALIQTIPYISYFFNLTIFFSMATSLVGNGISLIDFLHDLLKIPLEKRKGTLRLGLSLGVFALVFLIVFIEGDSILKIIQQVSSPLGSILIDGLAPILMVLQARYFYKLATPRMLLGGGGALSILSLGMMILIYLEGLELIGT